MNAVRTMKDARLWKAPTRRSGRKSSRKGLEIQRLDVQLVVETRQDGVEAAGRRDTPADTYGRPAILITAAPLGRDKYQARQTHKQITEARALARARKERAL